MILKTKQKQKQKFHWTATVLNHGGGEGDYTADKWKQIQNNLIRKTKAVHLMLLSWIQFSMNQFYFRIATSFTQMRKATQKPIQPEFFFSVDETIRTKYAYSK